MASGYFSRGRRIIRAAMSGFYCVDCVGCGKPIFLGPFSQTIPDVTLPEGPIRCPYCEDRTIYTRDPLVYYERLSEKALRDLEKC
jgi:DNA-directed RNA polymerase subunit RPC12/RpoP